jgi:hypothetical protein
MAFWKFLTFAGLFFNLVGVVLLFRYALPKRQRTDGVLFTWSNVDKPNQELIRLERRWDFWSEIDLWRVIIGIALQGFGVWLSPQAGRFSSEVCSLPGKAIPNCFGRSKCPSWSAPGLRRFLSGTTRLSSSPSPHLFLTQENG